MADVKPPVRLELEWESGLKFVASDVAHEWVIDGNGEGGPTPVQSMASALAACMAIDLVHILTRGRFPPRALSAELTGARADTEPGRFVAIDLRFTIDTDAPDDQIARAIALSHDKYCSVWHSMRPDIAFTTSFKRNGV
jgi:putative redox protein